MLKFEFDPERPSAQNGRNLFGVNYARMDPVRSTMELPATEHMQAVGRLFTLDILHLYVHYYKTHFLDDDDSVLKMMIMRLFVLQWYN